MFFRGRSDTCIATYPADQTMNSLSGGERTLSAIWRAVMEEPQIFLLDEPSNHLDEEACAPHVVSHDERLINSVNFDKTVQL